MRVPGNGSARDARRTYRPACCARASIDGAMIEMVWTTSTAMKNAVAPNTNESKNIGILNTLIIEGGVDPNLKCSALSCQDISGTAYHDKQRRESNRQHPVQIGPTAEAAEID
ncbi:MAG: hypothetical protein WA446_04770 [Steroidobacteraceae bacterium]